MVIKSDPTQKAILKAIEPLRMAIRSDMNTPDQMRFVERALERAEKLPQEERELARQIYTGIITLYQSDRRLETFVEAARQRLEQLDPLP
jgi:hypothetical protein